MNDKIVYHKKLGEGLIVEIENDKVKVEFNGKIKLFKIDTFDLFFEHNNEKIKKILLEKQLEETAIMLQERKKKLEIIPGVDDQEDYWEKREWMSNFYLREPTHCWNCKTKLSYSDRRCKCCGGYICSKCGECLCGYIRWKK